MTIAHISSVDNGIPGPNSKGLPEKQIRYHSGYDKFIAKCHY